MLQTTGLKRIFLLEGEGKQKEIGLPDPGPTIDPEAVRQFYLPQYPELLNSNVFGPEMKGDKVVWRFRPVIGEKG